MSKNEIIEPLPSVSVVIPTLGGESLSGTIEQINRGTLLPSEIIVCIPEEDAFRVAHLSYPNVRVVKTTCRGQVAQRAIGFQQAQQHMVLQLDDDVIVNETALEILANALTQFGPGNAVAPVYLDIITKRCCHEVTGGFRGWLNSLFIYVVCGAPWGIKRMGVMTGIGTNYGVDSRHCGTVPFGAQWLPGGCILCFREDLIRENFFPYAGKAFCEDIMHSLLRNKNGMRHWVIPTAQCFIEKPKPEMNPASLSCQVKARKYFVSLHGGQEWRLAIYEAFARVNRFLSIFSKHARNT